jgi:hypothetical protein
MNCEILAGKSCLKFNTGVDLFRLKKTRSDHLLLNLHHPKILQNSDSGIGE